MQNRRDFIRIAGIVSTAAFLFGGSKNIFANPLEGEAVFSLEALPYAFNALEPHIDAMTMEIHHDRHHKAYVDNLNKALKENKITETSLAKLLATVSTLPAAVRNNAGGHYNHSMFWQIMKPNGGGVPTGALADAINSSFENFENFKTKFNEVAKSRFGSGWTWLVKTNSGKLEISSTANQDNPMMDLAEVKGIPVLGLDVWEHAYYLKYQNKRPDYITAWWNVINWEEAQKRFAMK